METYHLHRAEDRKRVTLLHLAAIMDSELYQNTSHRRTDLAAVAGIGLGPADVLHRCLLVVYCDLTDFAVHFVEDLALAGVLGQRANSQK